MKKKKVLFLVNKDNVIYNFRRELAFELINQDFEVYISCPYGIKIDFLTEKISTHVDSPVGRRETIIFKDIKLSNT